MILNEEQYYKDRIFNLQNALKTKNDTIRQLVTENNNLVERIIYLEKELDYYFCKYTEGRGYEKCELNDKLTKIINENMKLKSEIEGYKVELDLLQKENDILVGQLNKPTTTIETSIDFKK